MADLFDGLFDSYKDTLEDTDDDTEYTNTRIQLTDADGNEGFFEVLDVLEFEDNYYAVLLPEDKENEQISILQVTLNADWEFEQFFIIEDERVMLAVFEEFKERHKDEFDFDE